MIDACTNFLSLIIPLSVLGKLEVIFYVYFISLACLYKSPGRAIAVTPVIGIAQMLKLLVKVFISLYFLKMLMDQVYLL